MRGFILGFNVHQLTHGEAGQASALSELIREPIKQSAKLIGEPITGRVKTGTSQSTASLDPLGAGAPSPKPYALSS